MSMWRRDQQRNGCRTNESSRRPTKNSQLADRAGSSRQLNVIEPDTATGNRPSQRWQPHWASAAATRSIHTFAPPLAGELLTISENTRT